MCMNCKLVYNNYEKFTQRKEKNLEKLKKKSSYNKNDFFTKLNDKIVRQISSLSSIKDCLFPFFIE